MSCGAASMYSLIATAALNGVEPRAWLTDVLVRIDDHPATRPPGVAAMALVVPARGP